METKPTLNYSTICSWINLICNKSAESTPISVSTSTLLRQNVKKRFFLDNWFYGNKNHPIRIENNIFYVSSVEYAESEAKITLHAVVNKNDFSTECTQVFYLELAKTKFAILEEICSDHDEMVVGVATLDKSIYYAINGLVDLPNEILQDLKGNTYSPYILWTERLVITLMRQEDMIYWQVLPRFGGALNWVKKNTYIVGDE